MKRWLAAILSVLLIVQVVPVVTAVADVDEAAVIDRLYQGMIQQATSIDLTRYKIPTSDFQGLYQRLVDTHPDLFFLSNVGYSYSPVSNAVTRVTPSYRYDTDELAQKMNEYNAALDAIAAGVDKNWTDWEIALYLHDYLVTHFEYDYTFSNYDAYSFLTSGTGVCQAYAYTYMALLRRFDIPVDYASSESMHHGWNLVQIGNSWYHVDVTWDDCRTHGTVGHEYFLISDQSIQTKGDGRTDIHKDWVASEQQRVCNSKQYENALWKGVKTPFVPMDGKWYFIGSQGNAYAIKATEWTRTESIYTLDDFWMVQGQNSYWQGYYSGLGRYRGELIWNTPYTVMAIDPYSKNTRELFENQDDRDIYGLSVDGSKVIYALRNNPNERESTGRTVEEKRSFEMPHVTGIAIATPPSRTAYALGEPLDPTGLTLTVTYSDKTTETVSSGFVVENWTASQTGTFPITVWYDVFTVDFNVTVSREIAEVMLVEPPDKTAYTVGESLDLTGLTLDVRYNDGEIVRITDGFTAPDWVAATAGEQTVTVNYEGYDVSFDVTVERQLLEITIDQPPFKTEYALWESVDPTGLTLKLHYTDGDEYVTEGIDVDMWTASKVGEHEIGVRYGEWSGSFTVNVPLVITGVQIESMPDKTVYMIGETPDLTGMTMKVTYNDNTTKEIDEGFEALPWQAVELGESAITVGYGSWWFVTVPVTVEPIPGMLGPVMLYIASPPYKTAYEVGESLDTAGMEVRVIYGDGHAEALTEGYTVSEWTATQDEEAVITVAWEDFTAAFTVTGYRVLEDIRITRLPDKRVYQPGETVDLTGIEITLIYKDGTSEPYAGECLVIPQLLDETGELTVTVYVDQQPLTFTVTVEDPTAGVPGDVDGNEDVTAADALMALQAATGKVTLTAEQERAANVDGVDGVGASDALMILQFATGKITQL
ncbi:MAG: bacterial Ig-like domain-containing protein [Acutalibacteraceae bacterium]